jgi:phage gp36-like protein
MPYISQSELETLFGVDAFDGVSDELWAQCLAGVDGLIEGKLAARYAVPLSLVPPLIKEIAADLARYGLHDILGGYDEEKNRGLKERYDYAIGLLDELASGKMALPGVSPGGTIAAPPISVAPDRVFSMSQLTGY